MPDHTKIFTYEMEGLSYTVTVYENPLTGGFLADIEVIEGSMDVNAVYYGDDDFSGDSESLRGPLNMNGARLEGDDVQWDSAVHLSDPGLGPDADEKETYISSGDTLTVELTDISSLDEIDVFGIRATSTTTDSGSIKAVSDDPEEPEEPEEPEDPEDPVFDKIGFGILMGENGGIESGVYIPEDELPEGQEGTFENYVAYYDSLYGEDPDFNITQVESVIFFDVTQETDAEGNVLDIPQELFRIDAPEGGFASAQDLLDAYDDAIESGALDGAGSGDEGVNLMAALSLDSGYEDPTSEENDVEDDAFEFM